MKTSYQKTQVLMIMLLCIVNIGDVEPIPQFGKGCEGECNKAWNKCGNSCPGGDGPDVQTCFSGCVAAQQSCMSNCALQAKTTMQQTSPSVTVTDQPIVNITKIQHGLEKLLELVNNKG